MALLWTTGPLNCHCGAKLLRVLSVALIMPPHTAVENDETLFLFEVISIFVQSLVGPALVIMRQARSKEMREHDQVLCTEIARVCGLFVTNVPYIQFVPRKEAQLNAVA